MSYCSHGTSSSLRNLRWRIRSPFHSDFYFFSLRKKEGKEMYINIFFPLTHQKEKRFLILLFLVFKRLFANTFKSQSNARLLLMLCIILFRFMSYSLLKTASKHSSVVAVVGKVHLQGIKKHWKQPVVVSEPDIFLYVITS